MVAYVYSLRFKITGQWYIGCRYAKHLTDETISTDLWIRYFTSSKLVRTLIKAYGHDSFEPKIRRIFNTADEAKSYEVSVLNRINARINPLFLNQCNSVFENAPPLSWITNGVIDTMIASNKPLIPGFWYGRSQNNKNRKYQGSPLKGRIHVLDSNLGLHRMIHTLEYEPSKHVRLSNDFNRGRRWVHNPFNNECRLIKEGEMIPNGWKHGNPHRGASSWFYNPITGEQKQIPKKSNPPPDFIKGRPVTHVWFTNQDTGKNLLCKIDEPAPTGYIRGRTIKGRKI